jgi:hypothetical protein
MKYFRQSATGSTKMLSNSIRRIGRAFGETIIAVIESNLITLLSETFDSYNTFFETIKMPQRQGEDEDTFCIHKSLGFQLQTE